MRAPKIDKLVTGGTTRSLDSHLPTHHRPAFARRTEGSLTQKGAMSGSPDPRLFTALRETCGAKSPDSCPHVLCPNWVDLPTSRSAAPPSCSLTS
jgi:hypothetical protein